ncbi:hypothetical protein PGIGA_G00234170, partial [Pangasianodon gigas]|nr:hypothetical protein [Pangasianodon gigas]
SWADFQPFIPPASAAHSGATLFYFTHVGVSVFWELCGEVTVDMFRCVCLFVLLPLCVLGQADVLLSTPSKSFIFPTDQPNWEETHAPTVPPTTEGSANAVGDYVVRAEWNSSACLMARMGLQFSFRMGDSFQTINLDPNVTVTNGTCGNNGSDSALTLTSDKISVHFMFTNQTSKFFLSALNLTVVAGSGTGFTAASTNLSLWEASLGSSYMCRKEQSFNITDALILNTFELQVQPFGVTNDKFSTAHECSVDDTSLLIPIIVGAALAVLILIVVIAYVIGRRKTYVGYQTL